MVPPLVMLKVEVVGFAVSEATTEVGIEVSLLVVWLEAVVDS